MRELTVILTSLHLGRRVRKYGLLIPLQSMSEPVESAPFNVLLYCITSPIRLTGLINNLLRSAP